MRKTRLNSQRIWCECFSLEMACILRVDKFSYCRFFLSRSNTCHSELIGKFEQSIYCIMSKKSIIVVKLLFWIFESLSRPPLWSSGQSSWLQLQRSRIWFSALPDSLSNGCGMGFSQPREDNWGATWMEECDSESRIPRLSAVGFRCAERATPSIRKSWH
jgi:hypothetical protein